ncbi:MAG: sugar phosphate nucleotidyltransferase [Solirubrobacterales bacterium]
MILAAGLGTRLRPMTHTIPKPMVPILDRPVMGHIVALLRDHGLTEVIANLHYFPDAVRGYFGDGSEHGISLEYRYEDELMGTAGGVRNCRDFFGDDDFLVISGDAITDIDLGAMRNAHRAHDGIATLAVKQVDHTDEFGVVIHGDDMRIQGFQEKPDPAEALSDLANCGIYMFSPEIFDYFPDADFADWATDVFPALLDNDVPFYAYAFDDYWNDVGTVDEFRQASFDAVSGAVKIQLDAELLEEGLYVGEGTDLGGAVEVEAPAYVGRDCRIGSDVRMQGTVIIGAGSVIGDRAMLRDTIIWPDTEIAADTLLIEAIAGRPAKT